MLSKIWIDLDHDNRPIVCIEYAQSEDIRDKMVKRFLDTFGADGYWAKFRYDRIASNNQPGSVGAVIRPIHPEELPHEADFMREIAAEFQIMNATPSEQDK